MQLRTAKLISAVVLRSLGARAVTSLREGSAAVAWQREMAAGRARQKGSVGREFRGFRLASAMEERQ